MPFFLFDIDAVTQEPQWEDGPKDLLEEFERAPLYSEKKQEHFIKQGDKHYTLKL